jgi:hypothetical protein
MTNDDVLSRQLSDLIKSLPHDVARLLAKQLSNGDADIGLLSTDSAYQDFWKTHAIEFLGGGNSKNYKISDNQGHACVLKIEYRYNNPYDAADKTKRALDDTLTDVFIKRKAKNAKGQRVFITVNEYFSGGDLSNHIKPLTEKERLETAANIYLQMSHILDKIRLVDAAHPDAKNSNWLIEDGKLRISDTKAIIPTLDEGFTSKWLERKGYNLLRTYGYIPPEFFTQDMGIELIPREYKNKILPYEVEGYADEIHAYQLGKNIYEYLTNCKAELEELTKKYNELYDVYKEKKKHAITKADRIHLKLLDEELTLLDKKIVKLDIMGNQVTFKAKDFQAPLFRGFPGHQFKELIQALVKEESSERMSVEKASEKLGLIQLTQQMSAQISAHTDTSNEQFDKDKLNEYVYFYLSSVSNEIDALNNDQAFYKNEIIQAHEEKAFARGSDKIILKQKEEQLYDELYQVDSNVSSLDARYSMLCVTDEDFFNSELFKSEEGRYYKAIIQTMATQNKLAFTIHLKEQQRIEVKNKIRQKIVKVNQLELYESSPLLNQINQLIDDEAIKEASIEQLRTVDNKLGKLIKKEQKTQQLKQQLSNKITQCIIKIDEKRLPGTDPMMDKYLNRQIKHLKNAKSIADLQNLKAKLENIVEKFDSKSYQKVDEVLTDSSKSHSKRVIHLNKVFRSLPIKERVNGVKNEKIKKAMTKKQSIAVSQHSIFHSKKLETKRGKAKGDEKKRAENETEVKRHGHR